MALAHPPVLPLCPPLLQFSISPSPSTMSVSITQQVSIIPATEEQLETVYAKISLGRVTCADLVRDLAKLPVGTSSTTDLFATAWKTWSSAIFMLCANKWSNGSASFQSKCAPSDQTANAVAVSTVHARTPKIAPVLHESARKRTYGLQRPPAASFIQ